MLGGMINALQCVSACFCFIYIHDRNAYVHACYVLSTNMFVCTRLRFLVEVNRLYSEFYDPIDL